MSMSLVYLIDVRNKTMELIGSVENVNFENFKEILKPFCDQHVNQLKANKMIILVDDRYGEFEAIFRVTYADWMDDVDYPYFYDVAEHDERVICKSIMMELSGIK